MESGNGTTPAVSMDLSTRLGELSPADAASNACDLARMTPTLNNSFKAYLSAVKADPALSSGLEDAWRSIKLFVHCCESHGWNVTRSDENMTDGDLSRFTDTHAVGFELLAALYTVFFGNYLVHKHSLRPGTIALITQYLSLYNLFLHSPSSESSPFAQYNLTLLPSHSSVEALSNLCVIPEEAKATTRRAERGTRIGKDWAEFVAAGKSEALDEGAKVAGYFEVIKLGEWWTVLGELAIEGDGAKLAPFKVRLPATLAAYTRTGDQFECSIVKVAGKGYWLPVEFKSLHPEGNDDPLETPLSPAKSAQLDAILSDPEPQGPDASFPEGFYANEEWWVEQEQQALLVAAEENKPWDELDESVLEEEDEDDDDEMGEDGDGMNE